MQRPDGRTKGAMRPVKITTDYTMYAEGSVLVEMGNTKVICTASVEEKVPPFLEGKEKMPLTAQVAAVSVGIFEDEAVLDLNYAEDSHAIVDCNVVMTSKGEFIEVQGTGEGRPFTDTELRKLLGLGKRGCLTLCRKQAKVMGESL